jgi:hypothetical protein
MFSRILTKLVDEAVLPALTLLAVRIGSAAIVAQYFGFTFTVDRTGFIYQDEAHFYIVNSYSTLAMIVVLALGLLYVLIKSHYFHASHIKPKTTARLFSMKLASFIQTSFDLYSQGAIWLSYSFLLLIASSFMAWFGLIMPWIPWVSITLNLITVYFFVVDVEREIALKNTNKRAYEKEVVLTWEEDL